MEFQKMAHNMLFRVPLRFRRPVQRFATTVASTWSDQMAMASSTKCFAGDFGRSKEACSPDIGSCKTGFDPHFLARNQNQNHFPSEITESLGCVIGTLKQNLIRLLI